ncbi:MAG TPA: type II toxin-antitoxin system VapB family antitoxin [Terriglobales bacterium]|nr:type II toxin-antitoxin system VapB family antitoxin [Terriglobales bacterium]
MTLKLTEETERLAKELAGLIGETVEEAVTQAVRERLDRVRKDRNDGLAERILRIGRDCAAHLKDPVDHDALLYDELGLPK